MTINKKAVVALNKHKAELEEQNHLNILQAILRIKDFKTEKIRIKRLGKVTVKDLAIESGVSRASLYGNHKSFLDELDKINKKRSVSVTVARKVRQEKVLNDKELIRELLQAKEMLAQENYRLNEENKTIKRQITALLSQINSKSKVVLIK